MKTARCWDVLCSEPHHVTIGRLIEGGMFFAVSTMKLKTSCAHAPQCT